MTLSFSRVVLGVAPLFVLLACASGTEEQADLLGASRADAEPEFGNEAQALSVRADLRVQLQGPATATTGSSVTYTLTASNLGSPTAQSSVVTVTLPAQALVTQLGTGCTALSAPKRVRCNLGNMAGGVSTTRAFTVTLPAQVGSATFTATGVTSSREMSTSNNSASVTTTLTAPVPPAAPVLALPQLLEASSCFDVSSYAECVPAALAYGSLELEQGGNVNTFDPSYSGTWSQPGGPTTLQMVFRNVSDNSLLSTFNGVGVSAQCFEGTALVANGLTGGFRACKPY